MALQVTIIVVLHAVILSNRADYNLAEFSLSLSLSFLSTSRIAGEDFRLRGKYGGVIRALNSGWSGNVSRPESPNSWV